MHDCRTKFIQLMQILFKNNGDLDIEIVHFLEKNKFYEESNINWKLWINTDYSPEEARNRYLIFKKMI